MVAQVVLARNGFACPEGPSSVGPSSDGPGSVGLTSVARLPHALRELEGARTNVFACPAGPSSVGLCSVGLTSVARRPRALFGAGRPAHELNGVGRSSVGVIDIGPRRLRVSSWPK